MIIMVTLYLIPKASEVIILHIWKCLVWWLPLKFWVIIGLINPYISCAIISLWLRFSLLAEPGFQLWLLVPGIFGFWQPFLTLILSSVI